MIISNIFVGSIYLILSIFPFWKCKKTADTMLRLTIFLCGTGHVGHTWMQDEISFFVDMLTGFVGLLTLVFLIKEKRVVSTLRNE